MNDVVIVGAGHNGLVAAFYLAKAGWKPLVLERRDSVGGGAATEELHPGFKAPALSHEVLLWADIARDMELHRHGVEFLDSPVRVFAPNLDGPPLLLHSDPAQSAAAIGKLNQRDATAYPRFHNSLERVSSVVASLFTSPPPDIDHPGARDVLRLLATGRRFRSLGRHDGYRLLRWTPMAVADFVQEWFENDLLCAALAAPGVSGTMLGPRSAGSALVLMMRETHRRLSGGGRPVRGGPGALAHALAQAATAAGAEIQTRTSVDSILVERERVVGVVANGHTVPARIVLSAVDPKTTFLRLIDPTTLSPDFGTRARHYRSAGTVAKVNLALAALPAFVGATSAEELSGHVHVGPGVDYLERAFDHAKYGAVSAEPWLDVTIPSVLDPQLAPSGAHVMSIYVHYAPVNLRDATWAETSGPLLASVLSVLERVAPGIRALVVSSQVITPLDLDTEYGFHGGHIFHGELALDQLFTMRPLLGFGRYDTPIRGLFLCGAGTHPGGFMTGASGRHAARQLAKRARALRGP